MLHDLSVLRNEEVSEMAKCEFCDKGVVFGIQVSHSHRRSNRPWKPNEDTDDDGQSDDGSLAPPRYEYGPDETPLF